MSADLEKLYRAASANADSRELNLLQQVRELGHYPTRLGANALAAARVVQGTRAILAQQSQQQDQVAAGSAQQNQQQAYTSSSSSSNWQPNYDRGNHHWKDSRRRHY